MCEADQDVTSGTHIWAVVVPSSGHIRQLTPGVQKRFHTQECTGELCAGKVTMHDPCAIVQVVPYIKEGLAMVYCGAKGCEWHVPIEHGCKPHS